MTDVVDIPGFPRSCIFLVLCPVDSLQRLTNKQFFNVNEALLIFYFKAENRVLWARIFTHFYHGK